MVAGYQIWCRSWHLLLVTFLTVLLLGVEARVLAVMVRVGAVLPVFFFLPKMASNSVKFLLGVLGCLLGGLGGDIGRGNCRFRIFLDFGGWWCFLVDFWRPWCFISISWFPNLINSCWLVLGCGLSFFLFFTGW